MTLMYLLYFITDIYDDKIGRIQNAIIQNERIKNKAARTEVSNNFYQSSFTIASDYETTHMEGQAENHKSISENTATNLSKLEPTTQIGDKDDFTPLENDIQDNIKDNKDVTFTSTKSTLKENEDHNRSLSLLMPQDLLSCVFSTTSTSNIPSNLYALCGLWDFAGQKEFYATHQAFLTSSAIYLVVADIRDDIFQEDTKRCFAEFRHVGEYVDFWFDTIHCHRTVHSQVNEPYNHYIDPPIIVVFTGKDKYEEKNKGKQNIEKRLKELQLQLDMLFGDHSKYHHLRKIFCLSNSNDPDEEFKKLRLEISTTAKKMDNWGECMPLKWILLEHLIEIIKQDGKNFINLSDMVHMAKHRDINILDIKDVLIFLRFQHETGNIIFFEDIQDFIILNPNWLVDAFRCLVSDKVDDKLQHRGDWTEFARKGHISDSLITELFKSKCGSQFLEERKNLVKVMEKFDILVRLDEAGKYVMPSMMPNEKFEKVCKQIGVENPNCKRSSWLCLKFAFLPPAFFNHFTVWFMKIYKPSKIDNKQHRLALFRGICVFDIGEFGCEKLLVSMSSNTIALQHLSFSTNDFGSGCSNIHKELIRKIEDIKKRYKLEISHELHFKCSTGLYYEDTISYQTLKKSKEYYCEEHKRVHQSEKIYLPWMKDADEVSFREVYREETLVIK
ncbi:unnamed protein product [Mytilus coruscus]|uniref:COR domain-containing protein n=1 Tax=Mytilus coruscus TaxID=42192 RepID=A0A6J8EG71_MYTCO|nr:unnamed protein product [Mytilus coruscus]